MNICINSGSSKENEMSKFFVYGKKIYLVNKSCNIFDGQNYFRQICILISEHYCLEIFMHIIIFIHCILLSQFNFNKKGEVQNQNYIKAFYLFNITYITEIIIKIVANGFTKSKRSFLQNKYNLIDLICGVFSIIGLFSDSFTHFEIFKLYRILSTLRFRLGFNNLHLLMQVITNSFKYTIQILSLLLLILIIFTLLGQSMFQGRLNYRCRYSEYPVNGQWIVNNDVKLFCKSHMNPTGVLCPSGNTCGSDYQYRHLIKPELFLIYLKDVKNNYGITQYDNIVSSFMTSFQLLNLTQWQDIVYLFHGFYPDSHITIIYMLLLIIICNYFIVNMIVAAMMEQYRILKIQKEPFMSMSVNGMTEMSMLFPKNKKSICSFIKYILKETFMHEFKKKEIWGKYKVIRRTCYKIGMHPVFSVIVYIAILCNCIMLGLDQQPQLEYLQKQDILLNAMGVFFILEQMVKLYGIGGEEYLQIDKFNQFDLLIVGISSLSLVSQNPTISGLPSLQLLRFFRLFMRKSDKGNSISILIASFFGLLPIFVAFTFLFALHIYVFSIVGMNLFQERMVIPGGGELRENFDTFQASLATVFQIVLRQKWNNIWYLAYLAVGFKAHLYFMILLASGQFLIFQSFVAITLGIFQQNRRSQTLQVQKAMLLIRKLFQKKRILDEQNQDVVRVPFLSNKIIQQFKRKSTANNLGNVSQHLSDEKNMDIIQEISDEKFKQIQQEIILLEEVIGNDEELQIKEDNKKQHQQYQQPKKCIYSSFKINDYQEQKKVQSDIKKQAKFDMKHQNYEYTKSIKLKKIYQSNSLQKNIFHQKDHVQEKQITTKPFKQKSISLQKNDFKSHLQESFTFQQKQPTDVYTRQNTNPLFESVSKVRKTKLINNKHINANANFEDQNKLFSNALLITPYKQFSNFLNPDNFKAKKKRKSSLLKQNQIKIKQMSIITQLQSYSSKKQNYLLTPQESVQESKVKVTHWYKFKKQLNELTLQQILKHMSESSWFIFHQKSELRIFLTKILATKFWDRFTLILIFANGVLLVVDNPVVEKGEQLKQVTHIMGVGFTLIFLCEMACKIISMGFLFNSVNNDKAYIRSYWNIVDFIVVTFGALVLVEKDNTKLKSFLVMRSFRALRPLKVINKNEELKIIVNTLFQIIPQLGKVMMILLIVIVSVSIIFQQTFKGTFYSCYDSSGIQQYSRPFLLTKQDCLSQNYQWLNTFYNYDTTFQASLCIFKIITGGEWLSTLHSSMDAQGIDLLPKKQFRLGVWVTYYMLVLVGNVMVMNLLVGLVLDNFKQTKNKLEGYLGLSREQREWADLQKFVQKRSLIHVHYFGEEDTRTDWQRLQKRLYLLNNNPKFEKVVICITLVNIILIGATSESMTLEVKQRISVFHYLVLFVYHIEICVQLMGNGVYYYARGWAQGDLIIVIFADIIFILTEIINHHAGMFRTVLVLRVIKIGKFLKYTQKSKVILVILSTYEKILSQLISIGLLFFLFIFIFAIMGMNVFAKTWVTPYKDGVAPQQINDFSTFPGCLMVLTQLATLQKWDFYLQQLVQDKQNCIPSQSLKDIQAHGIKGCSTFFAYPYFIIFVVIVPLVTMNLFVAVVIQGYEMSLRENEAELLPKQIDELIDKWAEYDPQGTGFLTPQNFAFLLYELPPPIGFNDGNTYYEQQVLQKHGSYMTSPNKKVVLSKKQIMDVNKRYNLILYSNRMLHFKDVYLCISHHVLCRKYKLVKLEINQKYVIKQLNKGWFNIFPNLKKMHQENKKQLNMNSEVLLSLDIISDYIKKWRDIRYQKKLQKNIQQIQYKLKQDGGMNDYVQYSQVVKNKTYRGRNSKQPQMYTRQQTKISQKSPSKPKKIETNLRNKNNDLSKQKFHEQLLEKGMKNENQCQKSFREKRKYSIEQEQLIVQNDFIQLDIKSQDEQNSIQNNFPFEVHLDEFIVFSGDSNDLEQQ